MSSVEWSRKEDENEWNQALMDSKLRGLSKKGKRFYELYDAALDIFEVYNVLFFLELVHILRHRLTEKSLKTIRTKMCSH